MGSAASKAHPLLSSGADRNGGSLALAERYVRSGVYLWVRFWIYATGLEKHEELFKRLAAQIRYRPTTGAVHRGAFYHGVTMSLVELWLRTLKAVTVPDVFFRFLCANFLLHFFYEMGSSSRAVAINVLMRLTAKGRRTLRLRSQLECANTFQERQSIAGELDKIEGKDKWREDPSSDLFLFDRVINKTEMYKVVLCCLDGLLVAETVGDNNRALLVCSTCCSRTTLWV